MNQLRVFASGILALIMMISCNSGSSDKGTATTADSTATDTTAMQKMPETPAPTRTVLLIRHKVRNFGQWFSAFEEHDSVRKAYGLHSYVVGRELGDSNMVLVALLMDDTARAREFTMLPNLKEAMKKGGVIGAPSFRYERSVWHDSTTDTSTTRVLVTHKVKDFAAWQKVFDDHKAARSAAGVIDRGINRNLDDSNEVTTVFAISDMAKAEAFMKSKDLKDKMTEAGVIGAPDIFMYHVAKQY